MELTPKVRKLLEDTLIGSMKDVSEKKIRESGSNDLVVLLMIKTFTKKSEVNTNGGMVINM